MYIICILCCQCIVLREHNNIKKKKCSVVFNLMYDDYILSSAESTLKETFFEIHEYEQSLKLK